MVCDESEDFFLGSPKKREQQQYDEQTEDSTPEKEFGLHNHIVPIMSKINSDFRDVFQPIENNSSGYEMIEKICVGAKPKNCKTSKKPKKSAFAFDENDDFASLFSNTMILKNHQPVPNAVDEF
jgi:hypothetical protein